MGDAGSGSDRRALRPHAIWFAIVAVPVAIVLIGASMTTLPDGQCSGIGWGCSLAGADLAGLLAILILPPAAVILLLGHGVITIVQRRRAAQRTGPGPRGA